MRGRDNKTAGVPRRGRGRKHFAAEPDLQLRSILQAGDESMVNLNGKIMTIGDSYRGYQLVEVDKQSATFVKNGVKTRVSLQQ